MSLLKRRRNVPDPTSLVTVDETVVPIGDAQARQLVRVQGQVTRMRARPTSGQPALAVTITDDSGAITAVWTGRRSIGGITLGRKVIIEGVAIRLGDHLEFTNPAYTLLP
jgi:RecG-like helicase